jgi:hypothetical protein
VRESYVRPPLVGIEPGSRRAAAWRFRIVALVVLAALIALVVWLIRTWQPSEPQNPGVGGALPPATIAVR